MATPRKNNQKSRSLFKEFISWLAEQYVETQVYVILIIFAILAFLTLVILKVCTYCYYLIQSWFV